MSDIRAEITSVLFDAADQGLKVLALEWAGPLLQAAADQIDQLAAERDRARMVADDLAAAIARLTGTELDGEDPWGTALAASYIDTWDRTPPAADIRTPGWPGHDQPAEAT